MDDLDERVEMVCRQTAYDRSEAKQRLEEASGDPVKVIEAYLGVSTKRQGKSAKNTHQLIFQELNKFVEETSQQPLKK